jgi:DNA-binding FadR family transcriptional regulator
LPAIQSTDRTTRAPDGRTPAAPAAGDAAIPAPIHVPQRYEQVVQRLRADVVAGRLAPGERLPSERDLARALGVGRASVREALGVLGNLGVLETRPGSGSFVAADALARVAGGAAETPRDASPSDMLEARALLEPRVARLASERAGRDPEVEVLLAAMDDVSDVSDPVARASWSESDRLFHRRLAALTANPVLLSLADHVAALMDEPLWRRLRDESVATPGRTATHAAEHRMIYEAVVEGDGDAAEFYAAQHIARVRRYMTLDR